MGPPQGVRFVTPAPNITTPANMRGFIPRRLYSGYIAETVIMYVVVPSPSRETIIVNIAVPITIFKGSPFTNFKILLMTGSNKPLSIIIPKYKIANISIIPVGANF